MSTLVPTRTTTVTVPCPGWRDDTTECRAPLEVEMEITGRSVRASYWWPAEHPEVYVRSLPTRCEVCGSVLDRDERGEIRARAEQEVAREF